jgi:excisionase family DNA binding protein
MWFAVVMNHTDRPLTTGAVAAIFGVTLVTVQRWAEEGVLPSFRTPGGHYRFRAEDVATLKATHAKDRGIVTNSVA